MKKILILLLVLVMAFAVVGCKGNNDVNNEVKNNEVNEEVTNEEANNEVTNNEVNEEATNNETTNNETAADTEESTESEFEFVALDVTTLDDLNRPVVTIEFEDGKKIVLKLVPEIAPNTVNNYITLAQSGYYDGVIFHRIIPGFMIQGGDPDGIGTGGPGYTVKDEFYLQEEKVITYLSHTKGIISMAKTAAPDSAGSQFFIMHEDSNRLDGQYSAFGYVVEGIEVVDELALVETNEMDKPLVDVVIKTITVELNGYEVKAPDTIQ